MNVIKKKYPDLIKGMITEAHDYGNDVVIVINSEGKEYRLLYASSRKGGFGDSVTTIKREEPVEGDFESFIDYLVQQIEAKENKVLNEDEQVFIRTELNQFLMIEIEGYINAASLTEEDFE
ncbi:hypothetical protein [Halomonas hibernica]|uniref:hypothetical protein n=1 Tax=Halomonas hibernica TaxID=2591147 RepID=UPI001554F6D8|nr:hypothetical protein [Halomonas hibernica]